jgi:hypothetical protein
MRATPRLKVALVDLCKAPWRKKKAAIPLIPCSINRRGKDRQHGFRNVRIRLHLEPICVQHAIRRRRRLTNSMHRRNKEERMRNSER